jgi:hypothetical protein
MNNEILEIIPPKLPFDVNEKIFNSMDEEGNIIGESYSYNDYIKFINDISGINDDLLGP